MIKADKTANGQTNRWTKQKAAEPTDKKTRRWTNQQTNNSQQTTKDSKKSETVDVQLGSGGRAAWSMVSSHEMKEDEGSDKRGKAKSLRPWKRCRQGGPAGSPLGEAGSALTRAHNQLSGAHHIITILKTYQRTVGGQKQTYK